MKQSYEDIRSAGAGLQDTHFWLDNEDAILELMPLLDRDKIRVSILAYEAEQQGWKAVFSQDGGWLAAAKAINAVGLYLRDRGVKFGFGKAGTFVRPILDGTETCIGVETVDGTRYYADKVVLATGAWSPVLVDLEGQCCSKAWVYAHLQLTPTEAARYKDTPVVYNGDIGFFFEPNE